MVRARSGSKITDIVKSTPPTPFSMRFIVPFNWLRDLSTCRRRQVYCRRAVLNIRQRDLEFLAPILEIDLFHNPQMHEGLGFPQALNTVELFSDEL